jgi:hypothetical protein
MPEPPPFLRINIRKPRFQPSHRLTAVHTKIIIPATWVTKPIQLPMLFDESGHD